MLKPHTQRNKRLIDKLLHHLYDSRRSVVINDAPHVKDFIAQYPALITPDGVSRIITLLSKFLRAKLDLVDRNGRPIY